MTDSPEERGAIAWMARNAVAANLLMLVLLVGGTFMAFRIQQEVFPEFELDIVQIIVPYPGASPAEVEQGILLAVEEAVRGLDGVERVVSQALEGAGVVQVELLIGADSGKALQDIKNAIDRITSFPEEIERPLVSLLTNRREVISLVIHGQQEEHVLRELAEQVRDGLLQDPRIVQVELRGARPLEISIEAPQAALRAYDLTLEQIADVVRRTALELPAGSVKTQAGEVLLRTAERRDRGQQFADIPVVSLPDGTRVRLGDFARIIDGYADTDESAFYGEEPAVQVVVYRIGDQTPGEVAHAVRTYAADLDERLPDGVGVAIWRDWSEIYRERMNLLLRNARLGLILVLFLLGVFLEVRLAFWVTLGIPVSILGSLLLIPLFDVSINMVSLFAFIVTIGIVVDDAIVVGENVHENRQRGLPYLKASILGAQWIAWPVVFSVLTNMVTFVPLLFIPGTMGKIFRVIPVVVIAVFLVSLIESLFVLPAHLAHQRPPGTRGIWAEINRRQTAFSRRFEEAIRRYYSPLLRLTLRNRYATVAAGTALLAVVIGFARGGHIDFTFFPRIDSDRVYASITMPYGTPVEETQAVQAHLVEAALKVLDRYGGKAIMRGIFTHVGEATPGRGGPAAQGSAGGGGHLANVQVYMVPSDQRPVTAARFTREWREEAGEVAGVESLNFQYSLMMGRGSPIDVELSHTHMDVLEQAAAEVAGALRSYAGVRDIDDGVNPGKIQLDFKVRPEARSLGITAATLGRQVRSAFYGAEALRQQRGRDEVKVMVRLPESERKSEYDVEGLMIRTPGGGEIPLREAAEVIRDRAYTEINRADGRRIIDVTADVVPGVANAGQVLQDLEADVLPAVLAHHPGLSFSLEGEQRDQRESLANLRSGFTLALIVIFAMLAMAFRSYAQPLIVMTAIPFGLVGATLGHLLMGYELSLMSMMGMVALAGVVVNDSLVLVHAANEARAGGKTNFEAVHAAGVRRFRPIVLTSLTTFFGLAPMIFETSVQAKFLIPMAISLGYGILFATVIALILVPSLFLIVEDVKQRFRSWRGITAE